MGSNIYSNGAVVLLSGGVDSAACLALLKEQTSVEAIFVDYGQIAAPREEEAATQIARHYGVKLRAIRCSNAARKSVGLITGRNAFLILTALMESVSPLIATGIHAGTQYWDCGLAFAKSIQALLDGYTSGRVQVVFPFIEWSKGQIWEFCRERGVPVGLTYSCDAGEELPCGRCDSCRDMEALHAR